METSDIDDVTGRHCVGEFKNISGNIGVMQLKPGTSNVPYERHKATPTLMMSSK